MSNTTEGSSKVVLLVDPAQRGGAASAGVASGLSNARAVSQRHPRAFPVSIEGLMQEEIDEAVPEIDFPPLASSASSGDPPSSNPSASLPQSTTASPLGVASTNSGPGFTAPRNRDGRRQQKPAQETFVEPFFGPNYRFHDNHHHNHRVGGHRHCSTALSSSTGSAVNSQPTETSLYARSGVLRRFADPIVEAEFLIFYLRSRRPPIAFVILSSLTWAVGVGMYTGIPLHTQLVYAAVVLCWIACGVKMLLLLREQRQASADAAARDGVLGAATASLRDSVNGDEGSFISGASRRGSTGTSASCYLFDAEDTTRVLLRENARVHEILCYVVLVANFVFATANFAGKQTCYNPVWTYEDELRGCRRAIQTDSVGLALMMVAAYAVPTRSGGFAAVYLVCFLLYFSSRFLPGMIPVIAQYFWASVTVFCAELVVAVMSVYLREVRCRDAFRVHVRRWQRASEVAELQHRMKQLVLSQIPLAVVQSLGPNELLTPSLFSWRSDLMCAAISVIRFSSWSSLRGPNEIVRVLQSLSLTFDQLRSKFRHIPLRFHSFGDTYLVMDNGHNNSHPAPKCNPRHLLAYCISCLAEGRRLLLSMSAEFSANEDRNPVPIGQLCAALEIGRGGGMVNKTTKNVVAVGPVVERVYALTEAAEAVLAEESNHALTPADGIVFVGSRVAAICSLAGGAGTTKQHVVGGGAGGEGSGDGDAQSATNEPSSFLLSMPRTVYSSRSATSTSLSQPPPALLRSSSTPPSSGQALSSWQNPFVSPQPRGSSPENTAAVVVASATSSAAVVPLTTSRSDSGGPDGSQERDDVLVRLVVVPSAPSVTSPASSGPDVTAAAMRRPVCDDVALSSGFLSALLHRTSTPSNSTSVRAPVHACHQTTQGGTGRGAVPTLFTAIPFIPFAADDGTVSASKLVDESTAPPKATTTAALVGEGFAATTGCTNEFVDAALEDAYRVVRCQCTRSEFQWYVAASACSTLALVILCFVDGMYAAGPTRSLFWGIMGLVASLIAHVLVSFFSSELGPAKKATPTAKSEATHSLPDAGPNSAEPLVSNVWIALYSIVTQGCYVACVGLAPQDTVLGDSQAVWMLVQVQWMMNRPRYSHMALMLIPDTMVAVLAFLRTQLLFDIHRPSSSVYLAMTLELASIGYMAVYTLLIDAERRSMFAEVKQVEWLTRTYSSDLERLAELLEATVPEGLAGRLVQRARRRDFYLAGDSGGSLAALVRGNGGGDGGPSEVDRGWRLHRTLATATDDAPYFLAQLCPQDPQRAGARSAAESELDALAAITSLSSLIEFIGGLAKRYFSGSIRLVKVSHCQMLFTAWGDSDAVRRAVPGRPRRDVISGVRDMVAFAHLVVEHLRESPDVLYKGVLGCGSAVGAVLGQVGAAFELYGSELSRAAALIKALEWGEVVLTSRVVRFATQDADERPQQRLRASRVLMPAKISGFSRQYVAFLSPVAGGDQ